MELNQHTVFCGITIKISGIRQDSRVVAESVIGVLANRHGHTGSETV
jgi:hypothetical protein